MVHVVRDIIANTLHAEVETREVKGVIGGQILLGGASKTATQSPVKSSRGRFTASREDVIHVENNYQASAGVPKEALLVAATTEALRLQPLSHRVIPAPRSAALAVQRASELVDLGGRALAGSVGAVPLGLIRRETGGLEEGD